MTTPILHHDNLWRAHDDATSGLSIDGRDYYVAFYEAARKAKKSILLLGWQFDSDVELLRGADVPRGATRENLELLPFLDLLARERPELEIRVLAWDHSVFFALEREVLQKVVFDITTGDRFHFRWDNTAPLPGSHHQKVAVIDGNVGFLGSQDICQERWDDSTHVPTNPLRVCRDGVPYKPYHEVQVALAGEPARSLVDLFIARWARATGEELDRDALIDEDATESPLMTLAMPRGRVSLARTIRTHGKTVHEIRDQYIRAIETAERLIYIETQYFTSSAIREALASRMRDRGRSTLDIVLVLPAKPEKLKEEIAVGIAQAQTLTELAQVAEENGHRLAVYNVAAKDGTGADVHVYVHSKLMIIDDRFMTVGSANLTNRSMSLDSEINASWEAGEGDRALSATIARARSRLLLEHLGDGGDPALVASGSGLVTRLDETVAAGRGRLRHHVVAPSEPTFVERALAEFLDPVESVEPHAA